MEQEGAEGEQEGAEQEEGEEEEAKQGTVSDFRIKQTISKGRTKLGLDKVALVPQRKNYASDQMTALMDHPEEE